MQTLILLSVLAQVIAPAPAPASLERTPHTFSDGKRSYKLWESPVLVAEPAPTAERRKALLALDPSAVVVIDRPTMRVWNVREAVTLRAKVAALRPVFHDNRAGTGRYRVPLALVCGGTSTPRPWLEVLQGSDGTCLPNFWYPPVLK